MSLILLNLAGGDCVADLEKLEADAGLCKVMHKVEHHGLPRSERRRLERRFRKERRRTFVSPSPVFRYLAAFHDSEQEAKRQAHSAFIPEPNINLQALAKINRDLVAYTHSRSPQTHATLDMDATLVNSEKSQALSCYQHYKAYQPFNVYWFEQDQIVLSEFRDGNVPAGYQQLRLLQESLNNLPAGVETASVRSDTAAYQQELLRYCAEGGNERCGKSEEVHAVMKDDLAGGKLPAGDFGENAAWWGIMILALNLNAAMKRLALPTSWRRKRFKAIRFGLINIAGQVRQRSRQLQILISDKKPAYILLLQIRERIQALAREGPPIMT